VTEFVAPSPVPAQVEAAPEQVLSAVAPASFNLPALPPIPEKPLEPITAEDIKVEAPAAPITHLESVTTHEVIVAVEEATASLTADITASATHAPETTTVTAVAEPVEPVVATSTIDFRSHLDIAPHAEHVEASIAEAVNTPPEPPLVAEPAVTPPTPAQGDLLAHAGVATPVSHDESSSEDATDTEGHKKDASHG
jgi:ribonuclease E